MRKTLSIAIAGFGDPTTGLPYRIRALASGDVGSTVIATRILAEHPSEVASSALPREGWARQSSFSFSCRGLDRDPYGAALLSFLYQADPEPVATLAADLSDSATTVNVTTELLRSYPATPFTVYVGREAIVVGVVTGTPAFASMQRGAFGTVAAAHGSSAFDDRAIYTVNPIVVSREVLVYELDIDADTETLVWRGMLDPPEGLGNGLASVQCTARDAFAMLADAEIGYDRVRFTGAIAKSQVGEMFPVDPGGVYVKAPPYAVWRPRPFARDSLNRIRVPMMVDGTAVLALAGAAVSSSSVSNPPLLTSWSTIESAANASAGYTPMHRTSIESQDKKSVSFREVLLADPDNPYSLVRDASGAVSGHPFDIVLNLILSTGSATWDTYAGGHTVGDNGDYDWLPACWGRAVPEAFVDVAGIELLRDSFHFKDLDASNFIIGHEDENPTVKEIITRLLHPLFVFPGVTDTGKITLYSLLPTQSSVATITPADLAQRSAEQPWSSFERIARAIVQVGRTYPGDKYRRTIEDTEFVGITQNRYPFGVRPLDIMADHYGAPGGVGTGTIDALSTLNYLRWRACNARLSEYILYLLPTFDRIPGGSLVTVTYPALVGDDGERGSVVDRVCLVLEARHHPRTFVQTLRVLDLYPLTRADKVTAPAWEISAVTSNTRFTVSDTRYTGGDRALWLPTARYLLFDRTGALRSTDGYATSSGIVAGAVTLAGAWAASGSPLTPAVGDIVRIASYNNALQWTDKAYIGDSNAQLGSANDDAHRWGW